MKNTNDYLIISAIDPTRAYSCIKYLYRTLLLDNKKVECWCNVPKKNMKSYKEWGENTYSFCNSFLCLIPKVRSWHMHFVGFLNCLKFRNSNIICHDLFHYKACLIIKKFFPKTKIILYFTEIYNSKHSSYLRKLQEYFEKHSNDMDLMIECDFKRQEYRVKQNGVEKPSSTILNTIPFTEVNDILKIERKKNEKPIVVFSGGVHEPGEFSIIIDALKEINIDYELIFYCFGNKNVLDSLNNECEEKINGKFKLITNKSREEVLHDIRSADVGIVYYDPDYSINTRYAAPTKFFEYVSLGIPVMSSGNESLIKIIDDYGLGEYMKSNDIDGMKNGLYKLLSSKIYREQITKNETIAFKEHLCYEVQSKEAIDMIKSISKKGH